MHLSWMNRHERDSELAGNPAYFVSPGRATALALGSRFPAPAQFERSRELEPQFNAQDLALVRDRDSFNRPGHGVRRSENHKG